MTAGVGHVGGGEHRVHAALLERPLGVDRDEASVGVG